jgi:hypothetical protein
MKSLIPDFWGNGSGTSESAALLSLVLDTPEVDDEENKIGFTADVVVRLAIEQRTGENEDGSVTYLRQSTYRNLAESA